MKINHSLWYCQDKIHNCYHIIPTVFHHFHNLYYSIQVMETLKQVNYAKKKTESVKNRTACSERIKKHTSIPPKTLKN